MGVVAVGDGEGGEHQTPRTDFLRVHGNPLGGGSAVLVLGLGEAAHIKVAVYDLAGRLVRGLHDGMLEAGPHHIAWDGRDDAGRQATSGVYLVRARDLDRGSLLGAKLTVLR